MTYVDKSGLSVDKRLAQFLELRVLPDIGIDAQSFWTGTAQIFERFVEENRSLLRKRDAFQSQIDNWHKSRVERPFDAAAYNAFLQNIGYLCEDPIGFKIGVQNVDEEIASLSGPQLVVPILNARFALNAANARWGSLYDALYGTDVIPGALKTRGYDVERGIQVVAYAKAFLDKAVPLADGSHTDVTAYRVLDRRLHPALSDPSAFVGFRGALDAPSAILLRHNGLHIELVIDRSHPIGTDDPAGICDIVLESALTAIVDLEDSVAAVDAEDKILAYSNWLGLMRGDLEETFEKDDRIVTRKLAPDRVFDRPDGTTLQLSGRSLLLIRNVGLHMNTPSILLSDGSQAPEGVVDAIITSLIASYDLKRLGRFINSRQRSIYIVKPKLHGPEEAAFTSRLFDAVEDLLGLSRHTIKVGVMDEERRTSANLAATIYAVRDRIMFINTGFLDRTGDEIHTSMAAGPMIRKGDMKNAPWLKAYEDRNVRIGLGCGFSKKAQIGKGMWAMPDRMKDMIEQKIGHLRAGANTAWVPSPTAATLHALHYHEVDVTARQAELCDMPTPSLEQLLSIPIFRDKNWSESEVKSELENNIQSILGYVVRWVEQGIGCSKVPDVHDIGLMEDRATLRISSQHVANWLKHGVCSLDDVDDVLRGMALKVDAQNAGDPAYRPMGGRMTESPAFRAARALIVEGENQANGYTEYLLHSFRSQVKKIKEGRVSGA